MEGLILLLYLKVFSFFLITLLLISFIYFFVVLNKVHFLNNNFINIERGENFNKVIDKNFQIKNKTDKFLLSLFYKINSRFFNHYIHYGDFFVEKEISFYTFLKIITKPSNILNKITIVEGWSQDDLKKELSKYFNNIPYIPYEDILADTYYFEKNNNFEILLNNLRKFKKDYLKEFQNNIFFETYTKDDLLIIGSLIEKEGLNYNDKKNISSVIFNRLNIGMRLQIDASVLFAITDGKFNLNRELLLKDLKIDHPFNTYKYEGLPPKPISYVSPKTLDIILENYKTEFLFYFFNKSLNKHIFSINFEDHKRKLNEYRKNK